MLRALEPTITNSFTLISVVDHLIIEAQLCDKDVGRIFFFLYFNNFLTRFDGCEVQVFKLGH